MLQNFIIDLSVSQLFSGVAEIIKAVLAVVKQLLLFNFKILHFGFEIMKLLHATFELAIQHVDLYFAFDSCSLQNEHLLAHCLFMLKCHLLLINHLCQLLIAEPQFITQLHDQFQVPSHPLFFSILKHWEQVIFDNLRTQFRSQHACTDLGIGTGGPCVDFCFVLRLHWQTPPRVGFLKGPFCS